MRNYLRYYATDKRFHVTASYSSGLCIDSRYSTLEKTAKEFLQEIRKEGIKLPTSTVNKPTRHDITQLKYRGETVRPLTEAEERKFLKLLGL